MYCFCHLSLLSFLALLSSPELEVESENSVLACILMWLKYNNTNAVTIQKLMSLVHKEGLCSNFLADVVTSNHPILSRMPTFSAWFIDALRYQSFQNARKTSLGKKTSFRKVLNSNITRFFVCQLKKTEDFKESGRCFKIYTMDKSVFLSNGYFIKMLIYFGQDGDVFLKMFIPNLLGEKGEIFLKGDFWLSMHLGDASLRESEVQPQFLFVQKNILSTTVEEAQQLIHLKRVPMDKIHNTNSVYAKLRISFC